VSASYITGEIAIDLHLLSQFLISGIIMGILYCLISMGINFIYGIMKVINWAMGEFFMVGAFIQYLLLTHWLPKQYWFVGVLISSFCMFVLGAIVQRILIKPMFVGIIEAKMEYATIVTISLAIFFRNIAISIAGPKIYTPPDYAGPTFLLTLPISGNRLVAFIGALVLLVAFYYFIKKTWSGRAFQGVAQNRTGIQTAGVNVIKYDMLAFGLGTALAGAAGALLAPIFLVYPLCGIIPTVRGFEIIVIAGLGSIPGILVAGLSIGIVESLGTAFISPSFVDIYGFILLVIILSIKPYGLFGKAERMV
jgi:branched-chain amino acid transport system permease protein